MGMSGGAFASGTVCLLWNEFAKSDDPRWHWLWLREGELWGARSNRMRSRCRETSGARARAPGAKFADVARSNSRGQGGLPERATRAGGVGWQGHPEPLRFHLTNCGRRSPATRLKVRCCATVAVEAAGAPEKRWSLPSCGGEGCWLKSEAGAIGHRTEIVGYGAHWDLPCVWT